MLTGDAVIDHDVDRFLGAVVDDVQTFQAPTVRQSIHDEVHRPELIRCRRQRQRLVFMRHAVATLALGHGPSALVQTEHALVVGLIALLTIGTLIRDGPEKFGHAPGM